MQQQFPNTKDLLEVFFTLCNTSSMNHQTNQVAPTAAEEKTTFSSSALTSCSNVHAKCDMFEVEVARGACRAKMKWEVHAARLN